MSPPVFGFKRSLLIAAYGLLTRMPGSARTPASTGCPHAHPVMIRVPVEASTRIIGGVWRLGMRFFEENCKRLIELDNNFFLQKLIPAFAF
jgi:hypothetical protein